MCSKNGELYDAIESAISREASKDYRQGSRSARGLVEVASRSLERVPAASGGKSAKLRRLTSLNAQSNISTEAVLVTFAKTDTCADPMTMPDVQIIDSVSYADSQQRIAQAFRTSSIHLSSCYKQTVSGSRAS